MSQVIPFFYAAEAAKNSPIVRERWTLQSAVDFVYAKVAPPAYDDEIGTIAENSSVMRERWVLQPTLLPVDDEMVPVHAKKVVLPQPPAYDSEIGAVAENSSVMRGRWVLQPTLLPVDDETIPICARKAVPPQLPAYNERETLSTFMKSSSPCLQKEVKKPPKWSIKMIIEWVVTLIKNNINLLYVKVVCVVKNFMKRIERFVKHLVRIFFNFEQSIDLSKKK